MAGLVLGRARVSSSAWLARNHAVFRAYSTTDPTQQTPVAPLGEGDTASLMREAEGSENWELFKLWRILFKRKYKSEREILYRYNIFCESKKRVDMSNKRHNGRCTFGMNLFADMTLDEVRSRLNGGRDLRNGRRDLPN